MKKEFTKEKSNWIKTKMQTLRLMWQIITRD